MRIATDMAERAPALLDSSAALALVLADHPAHEATTRALSGRPIGLAGHAWFETYSVLTRLPGAMRRSPTAVGRLLRENFPGSGFLDASVAADLSVELARLGIAGGSVYDALVGAAARQRALPLVSADFRARATYEALGIDVEWVTG